jgi:hypothetical protein
VNNKLDLSFLRSCDSDCYNAIASLLRDLTENLTPLRGQTGALLQAVEGVVLCHFCRVLPTFAFSTLRHATHLLSADYINYGNISIQIKDKFRLEVRHYTDEGKTTAGMRQGHGSACSPTFGLLLSVLRPSMPRSSKPRSAQSIRAASVEICRRANKRRRNS